MAERLLVKMTELDDAILLALYRTRGLQARDLVTRRCVFGSCLALLTMG